MSSVLIALGVVCVFGAVYVVGLVYMSVSIDKYLDDDKEN